MKIKQELIDFISSKAFEDSKDCRQRLIDVVNNRHISNHGLADELISIGNKISSIPEQALNLDWAHAGVIVPEDYVQTIRHKIFSVVNSGTQSKNNLNMLAQIINIINDIQFDSETRPPEYDHDPAYNPEAWKY